EAGAGRHPVAGPPRHRTGSGHRLRWLSLPCWSRGADARPTSAGRGRTSRNGAARRILPSVAALRTRPTAARRHGRNTQRSPRRRPCRAPRRSVQSPREWRADRQRKASLPSSCNPVVVEPRRRALPFCHTDEHGPVQPVVRPLRGLEAGRDAAVGFLRRDVLAGFEAREDLRARPGDAAVVDVDRRAVVGLEQVVRLELDQPAVPDPRPVAARVGHHVSRQERAADLATDDRDEPAGELGGRGAKAHARSIAEIEARAEGQLEGRDLQAILPCSSGENRPRSAGYALSLRRIQLNGGGAWKSSTTSSSARAVQGVSWRTGSARTRGCGWRWSRRAASAGTR